MSAPEQVENIIVQAGAGACGKAVQLALKRLLDIVAAACALVVLAPLCAAIALAIWVSSGRPVLYPWRVLGRGGRPFTGYKFRTMVPEADRLKASLAAANEMNGPVFKMKADPRVTPIGRWLRRFSLDEIPQLWSVLKGDMSLVGPRPVFPAEWARFEPWQRRKLSVTPGCMCLWHARGKPHDFEQWIRMDLEYIDRWSLWLDLKILARTAAFILSGKNC